MARVLPVFAAVMAQRQQVLDERVRNGMYVQVGWLPACVPLVPKGRLASRGPVASIREELEDLASRAFGEEPDLWPSDRICPSLDMAQTDGQPEVRVDIPGIEAKDIDIRVSGQRTQERKE